MGGQNRDRKRKASGDFNRGQEKIRKDCPAGKDAPEEFASRVFENPGILDQIFSFLDVRGLYDFTMASKANMQRLTYGQVVRVALRQGGHAKTSMDKLVAHIKKRTIWIPSPIRMIRLMNAKRCEQCNKYKVNTVSKHFGVMFCTKACVRASCGSYGGFAGGVTHIEKWIPFLEHDRLAARHGTNISYIFIVPVKDSAGDPCGPLIVRSRLEYLLAANQTANGARKTELLDEMLGDLDALDKNASNVDEIARVYDSVRGEAMARQTAMQNRKQQATAAANQVRLQKTIDMVESLCVLSDDNGWTEAVSSFKFETANRNTHVTVVKESKKKARFESKLVADLLDPLAEAPSKATKKRQQEVADTLQERFRILRDTGFSDFSFLSDHKNNERQSDAEQTKLWNFFRGRRDLRVHMVCTPCVLQVIGEGDLLGALRLLFPLEVRQALLPEAARDLEFNLLFGMDDDDGEEDRDDDDDDDDDDDSDGSSYGPPPRAVENRGLFDDPSSSEDEQTQSRP